MFTSKAPKDTDKKEESDEDGWFGKLVSGASNAIVGVKDSVSGMASKAVSGVKEAVSDAVEEGEKPKTKKQL